MSVSALPLPVEIRRVTKEGLNGSLTGTGLEITWQDGECFLLPSSLLRLHCPCAECKEKRGEQTHHTPLTPKKVSLNIIKSSLAEETDLESVWGIGNYAVGIRWGDRHDSGIYSFELLNLLRQEQSAVKKTAEGL